MKLRSVKDLHLVKKILLDTPSESTVKEAITKINSVLLREDGTKAVLYPYNSLQETILQLWDEARDPKYIAEKLGLDEDGEEVVLCVVEDQTTHEEREC